MNYSYLIGQSVKGFPESRITDVDEKGIVTFYFRNNDTLETKEVDLAQIQVATIEDR